MRNISQDARELILLLLTDIGIILEQDPESSFITKNHQMAWRINFTLQLSRNEINEFFVRSERIEDVNYVYSVGILVPFSTHELGGNSIGEIQVELFPK